VNAQAQAPVRVLATGAVGPHTPAFRIRTLLPRDELRKFGVELKAATLFSSEESRRFGAGGYVERSRLLLRARRRLARELAALRGEADVVLVQRQVDLLAARGLERTAISGRRLVLDVDDAIWLDTASEAGGHRLAFLKGSRRKVRWLASRADTVIAGNDLLAEWLARYAERVRIVPSLVDPRATQVRRHEERQRIVWGWIGSPPTAVHLKALADVLDKAARELDGRPVTLVVVGGQAPRVRSLHVTELPWSEMAEREALASMDVGLMPLPDSPWTRGKCAYKALQYMCAGIPVVADGVGVSAQVVGHERGGLIAGGPDEWVEALVELSRDVALRARLGATGRDRVQRDYSLEAWAPRLASILRGE
jgi:glycosyltransferase involved in cell wall biosynthesis